ncbi:GIN domain-containing protein [Sinomicrobium sp. M5D2P17]
MYTKPLFLLGILLLFIAPGKTVAQSETISVDSFDKVIINPHIQVTFREGDSESVAVEMIGEPLEKLHVEVKNQVLHMYLDGARVVTKTEKIKREGRKEKKPIYKGTVVKAVVTYKKAGTFSVRGDETIVFESPVHIDKMRLNIYGESEVYLNEATVEDLRVTIYGECHLEIKKGDIAKQKFTTYGESEVNTLKANNRSTRIVAYGDSNFECSISERLKVTSYGDATVKYKGNPEIRKGINIGDTEISALP